MTDERENNPVADDKLEDVAGGFNIDIPGHKLTKKEREAKEEANDKAFVDFIRNLTR